MVGDADDLAIVSIASAECHGGYEGHLLETGNTFLNVLRRL